MGIVTIGCHFLRPVAHGRQRPGEEACDRSHVAVRAQYRIDQIVMKNTPRSNWKNLSLLAVGRPYSDPASALIVH